MFDLNILHHGVDEKTYHDSPGLRSSFLSAAFGRSMAHAKANEDNQNEPTEAMRFGTLVHKMLENGEKFLDTYIVEPEFVGMTKDGRPSARSADARQMREDWLGSVALGKTVVTKEEIDKLIGVASAIKGHTYLQNILKDSTRESSLWVKDPETEVLLKCRPDCITAKGHLVDFKTARDASVRGFYKEIFYGRFYALQISHYHHCLRMANIAKTDYAMIVAIENEAPYGINVFPLDQGAIDCGERWRAHLTNQYKKCLDTGIYPNYEQKPVVIEVPERFELPDVWGLNA